ncbi:AP-3 complex subunit delta [Teratosphaeriaceae sp. CCFEE 6253]|nr:AP-3 complex subunit delta [Teratosphaeriaceae sp. CCFEE 6253]
MFEKDIYALIRGLRAHRGAERTYILTALAECRREVRSPDNDIKASALLKLVYLEMFGHDMSWAAFNVLEVMSAARYAQKRVGYLAAVQSFRPETEVLMLAENLLKKDLGGADKGTVMLVLVTVPHLLSPSMAHSLLGDLLPRLGHSSPAIRKKTIATLYRLALVYPETLRPAWPKIKDRLLDDSEDPSVTAAIINVVCELAWRRPQDFLPLAPRLFELLTAGGNNWMAIKIIKLFSTLTPLEPRLVKKLLPPLTQIIKTTPAMSLLYECINGIIQGGIMEAASGSMEGDEVARLCVSKLRAMLVVEGDPNLRYVALLAFAKITSSHADIVALHSDVILGCIDDGDISIRTRALDLVVGMMTPQNLPSVVERLLRQLRNAGRAKEPVAEDRAAHTGIEPRADDDDEDMATTIRPKEPKSTQAPPLPDDYRTAVIERILEMCSRNTYADVEDFEWYIGVLVELVKQCPTTSTIKPGAGGHFGSHAPAADVADKVGEELLNVAVRVKGVRPEAAAAAQSLLLFDRREEMFSASSGAGAGVLSAAAFIAGEYAALLPSADAVLTSLVHASSAQLPAQALASYLQAMPKIFATLTSKSQGAWTSTRRNESTLLTARIIHFLEPLTLHPALEVQERAVEYLDLMRLASEAASSQPTAEESEDGYAEAPLLLTQAIPSLFSGMELNPVAATALHKVPVPEGLDLDEVINGDLHLLLQQADAETDEYGAVQADDVYRFYHEKPAAASLSAQQAHARPAAELLEPSAASSRSSSYQNDSETAPLDRAAKERMKAERRERNRDDPYYIDPDRGTSGTSTPTRIHNILKGANGEELDVDAIPVMELKLGDVGAGDRAAAGVAKKKPKKAVKKRFEIAGDETLGADDAEAAQVGAGAVGGNVVAVGSKGKKSLLEVDSSGLSALSLADDAAGQQSTSGQANQYEVEKRREEEAAMAKAIKDVERLRLEMQRAQEQVREREGVGEEVVVVRKKKVRKVRVEGPGPEGAGEDEEGEEGGEGEVQRVKKKKKQKKKRREGEGESSPAPALAGDVGEGEGEGEGESAGEGDGPVTMKRKKKKKRQVTFEDP